MSTGAAVADAGTVTEAKPQTAIGTKTAKAKEKTGNLILDIAHEVEGLTKTKALNEAGRLAEDIEVNYFKMGGILKLINDNSWFEGSETFDLFVKEQYGFEGRKARYLIAIYGHLVTKQIPWEKVAHLGWTKLKDLAEKLTLENVDEWVAKAEKCTVIELQALLKGQPAEGDKTAKTTDDVVTIKFKLKADQATVVQQALAKAKGELHTDYDTVALENISAGYLGGNTAVPQTDPATVIQAIGLDAFIKAIGFEPLLERVSELFPEFDITVAPVGTATEAAAPA